MRVPRWGTDLPLTAIGPLRNPLNAQPTAVLVADQRIVGIENETEPLISYIHSCLPKFKRNAWTIRLFCLSLLRLHKTCNEDRRLRRGIGYYFFVLIAPLPFVFTIFAQEYGEEEKLRSYEQPMQPLRRLLVLQGR